MPNKKKKGLLDYIIYSLVVFIALYFAAAVGASLDKSVDEETGEINFSAVGNSLNGVVENPDYVKSKVIDTKSYSFKLTLAAIGCGAIFALIKWSEQKKRLHRKGVEHGSARWSTDKEAKKLADKENKVEYLQLIDKDGNPRTEIVKGKKGGKNEKK